ncbi:MAG: M48 family metallopeptidase [Bacteroidales bacterium]|jgi:STE24 endopeptidase|nr:M48 family metallopeptidase [Bacteroidales bacterium]
MNDIVFWLILAIPVAGYVTERILDRLNAKMWSVRLPGKLAGVCSEENYMKSQLYDQASKRLAVWSSSFNMAVVLLMIICGGFAFADSFARSISQNNIVCALLFFGIIGFLSDIINIPFSYYDNFVIENRFGFNRMNIKTFIADIFKSWLVAVIIGAPVLGFITWLYYKTGSHFWLLAWGAVVAVSVFINLFYSELIVPLFNRQEPLGEGSLRNKIESFAAKTGFELKNIYVIDGSKRSSKANAYFSGFGPRKRITLFDTLLKDLEEDEIVAVLAHETGHYRKRHVLHSLLMSVITTGVMLFLLSAVIGSPALYMALGSAQPSFQLSLVVFGILYSPLSLVTGLAANYFSRRNEFAADRFAKENFEARALASALKKLSVNNLSNMMPHPAYVFFHYSHPPLLERLEKIES